MPIHDWTRVSAGTFHDFHQDWTIELRRTLNAGVLPKGYFAMADQRVTGPEPDVVALHADPSGGQSPVRNGGTAVAVAAPRIRPSGRITTDAGYARKANRLAIHHHDLGRVVAVIEIVSPGNKDSGNAVRAFAEKAIEFLCGGVHLLLIDLFPPTPRDPAGVPQLIWSRFTDVPLEERPADKPLTVAAFDAAEELTAYVEPLAIGDALPAAPLFLEPGIYVEVPLEATYQRSWSVLPEPIRRRVDPSSAG